MGTDRKDGFEAKVLGWAPVLCEMCSCCIARMKERSGFCSIGGSNEAWGAHLGVGQGPDASVWSPTLGASDASPMHVLALHSKRSSSAVTGVIGVLKSRATQGCMLWFP